MKYAIENPNESANHIYGRKKKGVAYDTGWAARVTEENGKPQKEINGKRNKNYIRGDETYIWENLVKLKLDSCKLVASELLFPSLMDQAAWKLFSGWSL